LLQARFSETNTALFSSPTDSTTADWPLGFAVTSPVPHLPLEKMVLALFRKSVLLLSPYEDQRMLQEWSENGTSASKLCFR
jgi:hypothetical protein